MRLLRPRMCAGFLRLLVLGGLVSSVPAAAQALPDYLVRAVYFVPKNRTPQADYAGKVHAMVHLSQTFYAHQMSGYGYGPKTFRYEEDANGRVLVHLVNGQYDDTYYHPDPYGRVRSEVDAAGLLGPKWVTFVMEETDYVSNGNVVGAVAVGGSDNYRPGYGWGGNAVVGASGLWYDVPAGFADNRDYGSVLGFTALPWWFKSESPCPASGTAYTVGKLAGIALGGTAHEIGHAFGLNHALSWFVMAVEPPLLTLDDGTVTPGVDIDVMGMGYLQARGAVSAFNCGDGNAAMRINPHDAAVLNINRYFNSAVAFTDDTWPTASITSPANLAPSNSNVLPVTVQLADLGGSGLAYVTFWVDGSLADGLPVSGSSATVTRNIFFGTTDQGAGGPFQRGIYARVWDGHGNSNQSASVQVSLTNHEPGNVWTPSGPSTGAPGNSYDFAFFATDVENDQIRFEIDWGDGQAGAIAFASAGVQRTSSHTWNQNGIYRIRVRAYDDKGARSGWSGSALLTLADSVPPAAVSDLTLVARTATRAELSWTAPGDDGAVGKAASYELRYSSGQLDLGSWAVSQVATGLPTPRSSGAAESFTVVGLDPQTTYQFAVRARDDGNNLSPLSNVVLAVPPSADGGGPGVDGGGPGVDGGGPGVDGGGPGVDGGGPGADGGGPGADGGGTVPDGGGPTVDAGGPGVPYVPGLDAGDDTSPEERSAPLPVGCGCSSTARSSLLMWSLFGFFLVSRRGRRVRR